MPPPISWSDLTGRRVGVFGLGVEGRANLRAAMDRGLDPIAVDDRPPADLDDFTGPVLATGDGGLKALTDCDVVIKSPGISRYGPPVTRLEQAGVAVVGGLALWMQEADLSRVLVITGTKGKSTTTAITGHLLQHWGYRCLIGGNIGRPPQDPQSGQDHDYWVIEVSSYQAADMTVSPPVTAVTSLHADHLPWHRDDPELYYSDKLKATSRPGADLTVVNGDSPLLRERADLLGPRVQWVHAGDDPDGTWMQPLGLLGEHNRRNALIARACLQAMGVPEAGDEHAMTRAAGGFAGLDSRLRLIGKVGAVDFVDDSLSTNVLPTLAAVDSFPDRRVALLVGGQSRGIDYRPLAAGLADRREPLHILTLPDNGPDIRAQLLERGLPPTVTVTDATDLTQATEAAYSWALPDGVVLLSPAAPSFGVFTDYKERGAVFAAAMRRCAQP
jgi:UDP-N-acetylmuramoylalanine--D-glutamate ligase